MAHYSYSRRVAFCDTDAMGVVHHANYLRYFEEARVDWLRRHGLNETHYPNADVVMAVVKTGVNHYKPAYFDDLLNIQLQVRGEGLKIYFQYAIYRGSENELLAVGETLHVPVNGDLKPVRMQKAMVAQLESEKWIETWPSNS